MHFEAKGIPTKNVWHCDETKIGMEDTPGKVYADKGAKRVPVRSSGQHNDNLTGFLVQNAYGNKLPTFIQVAAHDVCKDVKKSGC